MLISIPQMDRTSDIPLYRQLYRAIRDAILSGALRPQARRPSTRRLAEELNIGRNTTITAFEQLFSEGFLETQVGSGTRVASINSLEPGGAGGNPPSGGK